MIYKSKESYVNMIKPIAQKVGKKYNYLSSVLAAQCILETGYGGFVDRTTESMIDNKNHLGMKSDLVNDNWKGHSCWSGASFRKRTPEWNGVTVEYIYDDFRVYDSVEQCLEDYCLFMTWMKKDDGTYKYRPYVIGNPDYKDVIYNVRVRGYCTDPEYEASVIRLIKEWNLTDLDEEIPDEQLIAKGKKVMLDAGHYGYYNQSPAVKEYWESKMTWKLHLMLKEELEKYGIIVGTTRKKQEEDMALYDRGYASKGYDLFLSLHSNAVGDNVNESVDYPVCFVQISGKSDKIGTLLSECVRDVMQTKQPADHWSQQGNHGDYFGVLRGATAAGTVGCIIEHSFHTQTRATKWLLKDENLRKLAVAEARVINDYLVGNPSREDTIYDPDEEKDCLSKGDSGDAVTTMQMMLIACGYSCGSYGADGDFGSATDNALKAFQKASGLTSNGHYDEATKSALEKAYKEKTEKKTKYSTVWNGLNYAPVYNYTYYKKKYADLRKAFGTDKQKYFEHFCQFGMKEGRQGSAKFNVHKYKKRYKDLRDAFGDDLLVYYNHFIQYGKKEGRKAT